MSLYFRISDATYSKDDFKKVSETYPNNFYAKMAYKLKVLWDTVRKNKANKATDTRLEPFDVMGNTVRVTYRNERLVIYVNGFMIYDGPVGAKTIERALTGIVEAEIKDKISIERPKGKSLHTDSNDLSPNSLDKKSLNFPKTIFKAMRTTSEGGAQNLTKRNRKNRKVYTPEEFNYLVKNENLDPDNYYKEGDRYIRNDTHVFELKAPKGLKYRIKPLNEINEDLMEMNEAYKRYFELASKSLGDWYVTYKGNDYKIYGNHLEKTKL